MLLQVKSDIISYKTLEMKKQNSNSGFDLLKGKWQFTNEPLWFKLLICVLTMMFFLAAFIIMK